MNLIHVISLFALPVSRPGFVSWYIWRVQKMTARALQWIGILITLGLLAACGQGASQLVELPSQSIPLGEAQQVILQIDSGEINISQSSGTSLELGVALTSPDSLDFRVEQQANEVRVIAVYKREWLDSSTDKVQFTIRVPQGRRLKIETYDAVINLTDYNGDVDVSAVAGQITASRLTGLISLKSNRGEISLSESSGELYVLGNYGLLSLENVRGRVSAASIMGTIRFMGLVGEGDEVRLETDHSGIDIRLSPKSDLEMQIRSTSGNLACMLPGLSTTPRSCDGVVGAGGGQLWVRTVSGDVTLQQSP